MNKITQAFLEGVENFPRINQAFEIAEKYSHGKVWLAGSAVYRTIAHKLYGCEMPKMDLDFILENPIEIKHLIEDKNKDRELLKEWIPQENRYQNPSLVNQENHRINLIPLRGVYSILKRELEPTIQNYLSGTPLTIQSIVYESAFDCSDGNDKMNGYLIGEAGRSAIQDKIVQVHHPILADEKARSRNQTLNEYIQETADKLGFTPIFPQEID